MCACMSNVLKMYSHTVQTSDRACCCCFATAVIKVAISFGKKLCLSNLFGYFSEDAKLILVLTFHFMHTAKYSSL